MDYLQHWIYGFKVISKKVSELSLKACIGNGSKSSFFDRFGEERILLEEKECLPTTLEIVRSCCPFQMKLRSILRVYERTVFVVFSQNR